MAEKDREKVVGVGEEINSGNERGKSGGDSNSAREKRATDTTTGTTRGTAGERAAGEEKEKVPQMVTVNVPEVEEKAKPKRKKKTPVKLKKDESTVEMLTSLICGGSEILAVTPSNSHWKISVEEGRSIAEPLSKVIAKNENLQKVMEQSDSIALLIATISVIAPRAYISYLQMMEKKKAKELRQHEQNRTCDSGNERDSGGDAPDSTHDGKPLLAGIDL